MTLSDKLNKIIDEQNISKREFGYDANWIIAANDES